MKIQLFFFIILLGIMSCKKNTAPTCYSVKATGRIIGYDPYAYYKNTQKVYGAGFVIELDKTTSKDTFFTYQIPDNLFIFPQIDERNAMNGDFLFPVALQNQYNIQFSYKVPSANEQISFACPGIVNLGPVYNATKGKQLLIACISKNN